MLSRALRGRGVWPATRKRGSSAGCEYLKAERKKKKDKAEKTVPRVRRKREREYKPEMAGRPKKWATRKLLGKLQVTQNKGSVGEKTRAA